ncbi:MAG: hypothetical protein SGILL_002360 [Bacillariaceae sp.]
MPAIYVFRRKTLLGGDDLQVPCLITFCIRLFQSVCLILPLSFYIFNQASQVEASSTTSIFQKLLRYLFDDHDSNSNNNNSDGDCSQAHLYPLLSAIFLFASSLFCIISLVLEYLLSYWSCQGTPTVRQPRTQHVERLLEWKLILTSVFLFSTSILYITTCTFAKTYHQCYREEQSQSDTSQTLWVSSHSWYILGALLFLSQLAELGVTVLFLIRLTGCFGMLRQPDPNNDGILQVTSSATHHHELVEEMWADRCNMLFRCLSISTCFLFGGQDLVSQGRSHATNESNIAAAAGGGQFGIYQHVAQALADYLETGGTLDVVPTDLVTGLLVLQRLQKQRILQARRHVVEVQQRQQQNGSSTSSSMVEHAEASSSLIIDGNNKNSNNHDEMLRSAHASPDSQTGLRSRVASSNDLLRQRSLSPAPHADNQPGVAPSSPSKNHPQQSAIDVLVAPLKAVSGGNNKTTPSRKASKPQTNVLPETTRLVSTMGTPSAPPSSSSTLLQPQSLSIGVELTGETPVDQYNQYRIYRRCQRTPAQASEEYYQATSRQVLNPYNPMDVLRLEEGARMAKYSLAIYTWMLYLFVHPIAGMPRLCCRSCKVCCLHRTMMLCGQGSNSNDPRRVPPFSSAQRRRRQRRSSTRGDDDLLDSNDRAASPNSNGSGSSNGDGYHDDDSDDYYSHTVGDNLCEWHKHALLLVAGLSEADLVYAQFQNRFSLVPYCILLDHDHKLVVLSIRGSLSLEDIVTDTLVQPEPLDDIGVQYGFDGRGQYCHAGVLACFENIYQDLRRHGLLEQLLSEEYPDYELRVVGHSLGAGVATLLSYVLKAKFPTLKVYGYSPPGCTMTWKMATDCTPWITSFVLDNEIVPRLSVLALEDLRDEVLELIGRIKVPKYKVFDTFLRGSDGRRRSWFGSLGYGSDYDDLEDLTHIIQDILDDVPRDTLYYRQVQEFTQVQQSRKEARGQTNSRRLLFYPPGRMIHLLKTGEEGGCGHLFTKCVSCCTSNSGFIYTPVYISNDDLDEIVVSPTMGTDHFIDRMCDELQKVSAEYTGQGGGSMDLSSGHEMV